MKAYAWIAACYYALAMTTLAQGAPMKLELGEPVLFLDDSMVAVRERVTRTFHAATKDRMNPVLRPDRDWEIQYCLYGTVIYDRAAKLFKMWHYGGVVGSVGPNTMYATSVDGLEWNRPALNLFDAPNRKVDNNIVVAPRKGFPPEAETVLFEPDDAPERRYKMLLAAASDTGRRYYIWYSPDGIRFSEGEQFVVERPGYVDVGVLVRDPVSKRYRLYHRAEHRGRAVAHCESDDLKEWTRSKLILHADRRDPPGSELYKFSPFPYGTHWIGMLTYYNHRLNHGMLWPTLAWSKDGVSWQRHRKPFIPLGGPGEWDRFNNSVATQPLVVGDELWFYYSGRTYRHDRGQGGADNGPLWGAIGLARLRLDGFASLDASFDEGIIETQPFIASAGELFVNAKADHGEVVIEALGPNGQLREGYTSEPLKADGVLLRVTWTEGSQFAELEGETVSLRFRLRNARLYAFRLAEGPGLAYLSGPPR